MGTDNSGVKAGNACGEGRGENSEKMHSHFYLLGNHFLVTFFMYLFLWLSIVHLIMYAARSCRHADAITNSSVTRALFETVETLHANALARPIS